MAREIIAHREYRTQLYDDARYRTLEVVKGLDEAIIYAGARNVILFNSEDQSRDLVARADGVWGTTVQYELRDCAIDLDVGVRRKTREGVTKGFGLAIHLLLRGDRITQVQAPLPEELRTVLSKKKFRIVLDRMGI